MASVGSGARPASAASPASAGRPASAASVSVFDRLSARSPASAAGSPSRPTSASVQDERWMCPREEYLMQRPTRMSTDELAEARRAARFEAALQKRLVAQKKAREREEEDVRWRAKARAEADEMIREAKERTRALIEKAEEQARIASEEADEREREEDRLALLAHSRGKVRPRTAAARPAPPPPPAPPPIPGSTASRPASAAAVRTLSQAATAKFGPLSASVPTVAATPVRRHRLGAARFMVLPVRGVAYLEEHARRITAAPDAKQMQRAATETALLRAPKTKDPKAFLRLYPPQRSALSDGESEGPTSPSSPHGLTADVKQQRRREALAVAAVLHPLQPGRAEWEPHSCSNCRAKTLFQARVVPASPRPPASWFRKQARQRQRHYAALMIQAAGRRFLARCLLHWRRRCFIASVPINACVRRFLVIRHRPEAVNRLNAMHLAAAFIQVHWRRWAQRRRRAAQKLWRTWRSQRLWLLARRAGAHRRAAVIRIQKLWRGVMVRLAFTTFHRIVLRSAARIQAVARMAAARRRLHWSMGERSQAARTIQRFWRQLQYRRWLRTHQVERRAGARVIQRAWRWYRHLRRLEERRRAREARIASIVRRCGRRWRQAAAFSRWARRARDVVIVDRHVKRRITAAATVVQTAWRTHEARLALRRGAAARKVQAAIRGALARRLHRRQVVAGKRILATMRRFLRYKRWRFCFQQDLVLAADWAAVNAAIEQKMRELRRTVDMPEFWRPGAGGVADRKLVVDEWLRHKGRVRALYFRYLLSGAVRFHPKGRSSGQFVMTKAQFLTMARDMDIPLTEPVLVNVFIAANRELPPPPARGSSAAPAFSVAPPESLSPGRRPTSPSRSPAGSPTTGPIARPASASSIRPASASAVRPGSGSAASAGGRRGSNTPAPRARRPSLAPDGGPLAPALQLPPSAAGAPTTPGRAPAPSPGRGGPGSSRRAGDDDGEEGASRMTASELMEAFMRLAAILYDDAAAAAAGVPASGSTAIWRVRRFVEGHVAALGDTALVELHASSARMLDSPVVRVELEAWKPMLRKLFARIPQRAPVGLDGSAPPVPVISMADFILLFKFAGFIGSGGALSYSMAVRVFLRVNRDELDLYLTTDPAGDGFVDRMQMEYAEFEEGVCQCAALWALSGDKSVPMGVQGANQAAYAASGGLLVPPLPNGSLGRFLRKLQEFYGV